MATGDILLIRNKEGEAQFPVTHLRAVFNDIGLNLEEILSNINIVQIVEDGFAVVDENLRIGLLVDEDGVHAKNILDYEIV